MLSLARRDFSDLSEKEILALAISSEEEDMKIYATYADGLRADHPASAAVFDGMAAEENEHRLRLIEAFRARFGETIPLIKREHVRGFYSRKPYWLVRPLGLDRVRSEAADMERQAETFYMKAAERTGDAGSARCSAPWRRRSAGIRPRRRGWRRATCRPTSGPARTRPPAASSC